MSWLFFISSTTTGKDADFSLTANDQNGFNALSALGINVLDTATKSEYTRFANMSDADKAAYIDAQVQAKGGAPVQSPAPRCRLVAIASAGRCPLRRWRLRSKPFVAELSCVAPMDLIAAQAGLTL